MSSPFDPKPPPKAVRPRGPRVVMWIGVFATFAGLVLTILGVAVFGSEMFGMLDDAEQATRTATTFQPDAERTVWASVVIAIGSTLLGFGLFLWIGGAVWGRLGMRSAWGAGTFPQAYPQAPGDPPKPPTIL